MRVDFILKFSCGKQQQKNYPCCFIVENTQARQHPNEKEGPLQELLKKGKKKNKKQKTKLCLITVLSWVQ